MRMTKGGIFSQSLYINNIDDERDQTEQQQYGTRSRSVREPKKEHSMNAPLPKEKCSTTIYDRGA
jgi:hypothetical protein